MFERGHSLPVTRQCELDSLARSTVYYRDTDVSQEDLKLMRLIDEAHLERSFFGSRRGMPRFVGHLAC